VSPIIVLATRCAKGEYAQRASMQVLVNPTPPEGSVPVEERLKAEWKCLTVSATPTNANIQTVRKKRGVIAVAETQERKVQANAD
jgi:hypothetical protein